MSRRYEELMERVRVTEEMRGRVLEGLRAAPVSNGAGGKRLPHQGVVLSLAACLLLAVGVFALPTLLEGSGRPTRPPVMVHNETVRVETLEELTQAVGFPVVELEELPFPVSEVIYLARQGTLAEIRYVGEAGEAIFRQSQGSEDNSGDYNMYSVVEIKQIGEEKVTLKGGVEGMFQLGVWDTDGMVYSLKLPEEAPLEVWIGLVSQMG